MSSLVRIRREVPSWSKWVLGIFATLATAGVVYGSTTLSSHGERIAKNEVQYDSLQKGQNRIESKQDRMENKLDRLIERLSER